MAKRRVARGVQRMPVLDSLPTSRFLSAETGLKQTTAMAWRNVFINIEEIATIVTIPEALLADVDYDLWDEFRPKVEESIGVAIDAAIFFGTGAPASWPTAIATSAIAAGNVVTQGAGVDVAADINNVMAALESDGYASTGMVHRQDVRAALRGLRSTTNEFIFNDGDVGAESAGFGDGNAARNGKIFRVPARSLMNGVFETENTASANATKLIDAEWSQFVLGIRQDITMKRFDTGVIQNATGDITFNLLQQDLVAARFVMRLGWACPNPINRTQTVTASRYPASVLRDAA
jgi:HK97 family phage major capsid protein